MNASAGPFDSDREASETHVRVERERTVREKFDRAKKGAEVKGVEVRVSRDTGAHSNPPNKVDESGVKVERIVHHQPAGFIGKSWRDEISDCPRFNFVLVAVAGLVPREHGDCEEKDT